MKSTKERLLEFLRYKKIKKSDFYKETGIKRGFLDTDKLKGSVSDLFITAIMKTYYDINIYWLLSGKGAMFTKDFSATNLNKGYPLVTVNEINTWGSKEGENFTEANTPKYIIPEFEKLKIDFILKIHGVTMYPKYNNGDLVACRKIPLNSFFQWNRVYVLHTSQGVIVKRLKKGPTENVVLCISDNPDFDDFELVLEDVNTIALVEGVVHVE